MGQVIMQMISCQFKKFRMLKELFGNVVLNFATITFNVFLKVCLFIQYYLLKRHKLFYNHSIVYVHEIMLKIFIFAISYEIKQNRLKNLQITLQQ